MEHTSPHDLQNILAGYLISPVKKIQPIAGGLINPTFRVETAEGAFALQRVHGEIPDSALEDMENITAYLAERGFLVPRILRSRTGTLFVQNCEGQRWRLYRWVSGTVRATIDDMPTAYKAGKFLGQLHCVLAELDYRPKGTIPHFHDTPHIVSKLAALQGSILEVVRAMPENAAEDFVATTENLLGQVLTMLPQLFLTETVAGTQQLIHGDPKASNLLWNDTGEVVGILDCDTFLWHYPAIDVGDALRSWCKRGIAGFDLAKYHAAADGYAEGVGEAPLTTAHHALYLRATRLITLELTARFCIDVAEDSYFGWDATHYQSRRAHNLARAQQYYMFFTTIPETI